MQLGQLLKQKGLITEKELQVAFAHQNVTDSLLGDTLVRLGFVSSSDINKALAEQARIPFIDLSEHLVSEEAIRLIPQDIAEKNGFIPLSVNETTFEIGVTSPTNIRAKEIVAKFTKKQPQAFMVDAEIFKDTIQKAYFFLENPTHQRINKAVEQLKSVVAAPPAIVSDLTQDLIIDGFRRKATDIHICPSSDTIDVSYRIDGVLQHGFCIPKIAHTIIVTKIKVQSDLDISEQRLPQDGAFSLNFLNTKYDLRVSTMPTIYGENVIIRILPNLSPLVSIDRLGFDPDSTKKLQLLFQKPYGIILLTGPTGSGKTTTLYAALRGLNLIERNVLTVEDPVEYKLSFVKQTSVNLKTGYDFPTAGKHFMRHDPDVMLIGEIRDEETAKIALRASITGHLVLSTLHTNDAVSAVPRLLDFNVDKFLLSSSLLAVVAQRLIRKLCNNCKEIYDVPEEMLRLHDLLSEDSDDYRITTAYKAKGCEMCNYIGYLGRTVIVEIMATNDEIRELISEGVPLFKLKQAALRNGMVPMNLHGIKKVKNGITSIEELVRVTG